MLKVYILQEKYSDNTWHNCRLSSAPDGMLLSRNKAETIYHLLCRWDSPAHYRMFTARLVPDSSLVPINTTVTVTR